MLQLNCLWVVDIRVPPQNPPMYSWYLLWFSLMTHDSCMNRNITHLHSATAQHGFSPNGEVLFPVNGVMMRHADWQTIGHNLLSISLTCLLLTVFSVEQLSLLEFDVSYLCLKEPIKSKERKAEP